MDNVSIEGIHESLFDTRVVERNIQAGKVTRAQYQLYLESLEDSAEYGAETETRFVHKFGRESEGDNKGRGRKSRRRR